MCIRDRARASLGPRPPPRPARPRRCGNRRLTVQNALGAGQSVLVLGGGSDIGLATVRRLVADRTRTVVLAARSPQRLAGVAAELRPAGATTVELVDWDADDTDTSVQVIDAVFDTYGDIDLVLVTAGAVSYTHLTLPTKR